MMRNAAVGVAVAALATWVPVAMAAPAKSKAETEVVRLCKAALAEKGHKDIQFAYEGFVESRGGYSWTGQFSQGVARYEYNCVVGKDMKLVDLPVSMLAGSQ